ncbi:E3 ubiquitin/ISG15 ligase TRIM25-like [Heterodontus francisci]|uniref:E3 ubiquitin/ISG15 ligase TRIM25-like n=1 Tax=Heterodontus francisci TaxID=7792 RepID=UPI00355C4DF4
MEAKALEEELNCAVCLQMYQDSVALPCQHSFCLKCIEDVWTQAVDRDGFSCPQCHRKFNSKPSLERIIPTVTCDHCIDSQSPAVKTCLKCETSFCCFHLKPHLAKEVFKDHELVDPVADLTHRKCPEHEKILEFFCTDDGVCVCSSCGLIGRHKSHNLVSLHEAEASIKVKLKSEVENLWRVQQNCSMKEQDLEKSEAEVKILTNELKGNLSKKFSEWRKKLEEDEKYALKLIDEEELHVLSQIRNCSEALTKVMEQIKLIDEETQNLIQGDHLSLIQNSKELRSRVIDTQNVTYPEAPELTLNLSNLSQLLKKWMEESETHHLATGEVIRMYELSRLTLDPKTANKHLILSDDLRSVMHSYQEQPYPINLERFKSYHQILCSQSFCWGCHSWDVETDGIWWGIGIAYGSIQKMGNNSDLRKTAKAWCLHLCIGSLSACHNNNQTRLLQNPSVDRIRVKLDYDAGTVSFFQVTDTLTHLHTFETTFTRPVYPAFCCETQSGIKLLNSF